MDGGAWWAAVHGVTERISVKAPTVLEAAAPGSENVAVLTRG